MLKWLTGSVAQEAAPEIDFDRLEQEELAVVFKHSTSCPTSSWADRQIRTFRAEHPTVPVYKVLVREQRPLSNRLADWTGVEHESPQVIVLRRGKVAASMSHGEVTSDNVAAALEG